MTDGAVIPLWTRFACSLARTPAPHSHSLSLDIQPSVVPSRQPFTASLIYQLARTVSVLNDIPRAVDIFLPAVHRSTYSFVASAHARRRDPSMGFSVHEFAILDGAQESVA